MNKHVINTDGKDLMEIKGYRKTGCEAVKHIQTQSPIRFMISLRFKFLTVILTVIVDSQTISIDIGS